MDQIFQESKIQHYSLVLLTFFILLLSSCATQPPVYLPSIGKEYKNIDNSVVALVQPTKEGVVGPNCSGFFISRTVLITAGHCILKQERKLIVTEHGLKIKMTFEKAKNAIGREVFFVDKNQYETWINIQEDERKSSPEYNSAKVIAVVSPNDKDIAILQISNHKNGSEHWLKLRDWGTQPLLLGEEVFALGNPVGNSWILTRGIISKLDIKSDNTIQIFHDARIGPGSSGGPLLDYKGRVVGINVAVTYDNIFSIANPSTAIDDLYKQYIDKQNQQN